MLKILAFVQFVNYSQVASLYLESGKNIKITLLRSQYDFAFLRRIVCMCYMGNNVGRCDVYVDMPRFEVPNTLFPSGQRLPPSFIERDVAQSLR